jgi:hypothetical protein
VTNIGDVVMQFLNAPNNVNAANPNGNAQQVLVVNDMLNFMSNYNVWTQVYSNNSSAPIYNPLKALQATMVSDTQGLYISPANFPTNPSPCVQ